jgi:HK97 gp10 family phage protein
MADCPSISYDFAGFDALAAKMDELARDLARPAQVRMVRAGANVFKDAVVERAPVLQEELAGSNALPPGAVRDGIHVYMTKDEPVTARVGPDKHVAHVARWLEYGHRIVAGGRARAGGTVIGEVAAIPFIRTGYEAALHPAEEAMQKVLEETVKKYA